MILNLDLIPNLLSVVDQITESDPKPGTSEQSDLHPNPPKFFDFQKFS